MVKILRDTVHNFIVLDRPNDELILRLIDTPEFQRLRRIRQLGVSSVTYHGAEHTRFPHCLGAMHVATKMVEHLQRRFSHEFPISEQDVLLVRVGALLHDLGHGPLSHVLEDFFATPHEDWTRQLIVMPDSAVNQALRAHSPGLPEDVRDLIKGVYSREGKNYLCQIVSSQLDADRMDFLMRDPLLAGVKYGSFDFERIIYTLSLAPHKGSTVIAVLEKGMHAVEQYVLARHFMYQQVMLHKATRGLERVLVATLRRAQKLYGDGRLSFIPENLAPFLGADKQPPTLLDFLRLDDSDIVYSMKMWRNEKDEILSDLADRFLNRRLLKGLVVTENRKKDSFVQLTEINERSKAYLGEERAEYYFHIDRPTDLPYKYKPYVYTSDEEDNPSTRILVWQSDPKGCVDIYHLLDAVKSIARPFSSRVIYCPREDARRIVQIIKDAGASLLLA